MAGRSPRSALQISNMNATPDSSEDEAVTMAAIPARHKHSGLPLRSMVSMVIPW